jgi:hypothetical protein
MLETRAALIADNIARALRGESGLASVAKPSPWI